jgi:hypothetical protein
MVLLLGLILSFLSLESCDRGNGVKKKLPPVETVTTVVWTENPDANVFKTSIAYKTVKDTFKMQYIDADSTTQKRTNVRDSFYNIPYLDTTFDGVGAERKIALDSAGKPKVILKARYWPREFIVHDFNTVWADRMKEIQKYLNPPITQ